VWSSCSLSALDTSDRLGLPRYEWVQNEYSLLARSDEADVIPLCAERGLGYTPHSPLCGGILSGKYRPGAAVPSDSRLAVRPEPYQEYMSDPVLEGVQRLADEANRRGVSPSGLALAWVMSRANVTAPVVGPRRLEHLAAIREAMHLHLDTDEQERLVSLVTA
jgi:aryl-alcohol dehydrogenase-like predicted oxidoreductase